ncbi:hypothetical protein [Legionella worsleiensis]|uniref:Uncharacterized protein n=1 Tax=Legionella worsleiensis TaxID=45076 RepID=A0A0W1A3X8_9GAMM|nr:hypothetical protein [Legionella worsleiensis]KTD76022.1 hypothetical protein Lwor_2588 [Legionella worsleiensis]STY33036.1 Uncharacterised protein [Legionella worsleiensis]
MDQRQFEIVVLKPTAVFLSFLASQLPEHDLPSLKTLHTDNTAYVISKQNSDEATLYEIEKHFSTMFRHEICRWLGANARNEIEVSFLDFLCCFKFELHSHIILMEPEITHGHHILNIKPRTMLLKWIKSAVEDEEDLVTIMDRVHLSQLVENSTVIVKNFTNLKEIKPFLKKYYKPIFEMAMSRMSNQSSEWPVVDTFQSFCQYFTVEIHTQLIYLHQ